MPQSFFYAIDAGMSIGFCTDVAETKVSSRAFTIVYILMGAAVAGGALTLFIEDSLEGCLAASTRDYRRLLEQQAFMRADTDGDGRLNYAEFCMFVGWSLVADGELPESGAAREAALTRLCLKFDPERSGSISWANFCRHGASWALRQRNSALHIAARWAHDYRVHIVFFFWLCLGVGWGVAKQKWDVITATHFAVSALATGGLTAPQVNPADGILPADDSIFVGVYCLFGIPLFALMLSKVARLLVERHVVDAERRAIATPLAPAEFEMAKSLCTADDGYVHLSDFVVLHLLRQGKVSFESIRLLRAQFGMLDRDRTGRLAVEEACGPHAGPGASGQPATMLHSGRDTWPAV